MRSTLLFSAVLSLATNVHAARGFQDTSRGRPLPLRIVLKLDLFYRTSPSFRATNEQLGPLLYPGRVNLQGLIRFSGAPEYMKPISEELVTNRDESGQLARLLGLRVLRLDGDQVVEIADAMDGFQVTPAPGDNQGYSWRFEIPVVDRKLWRDGQYRIKVGLSYNDAKGERTISSGSMPFEIRTLHMNSGEEINFLTSLSFQQPANVWITLIKEKPELAGNGIYERIAKLDPYDVFPRQALAIAAQADLRPELALEQRKRIQADFRQGRARRVEALFLPRSPRRCSVPSRLDRNQFGPRIEQLVESTERFQQDYQKVERRVKAALRDDGESAIEKLLKSDEQWVPIVAVRVAGAQEIRAAHGAMVKALADAKGLLQKEIVNSLARAYGSEKRIKPVMSWPAQQEIAKWWLDRPSPDMMPKGPKKKNDGG